MYYWMFLEQSFVLIFKALRYVCGLAKRLATQFFIANNLLYISLNILIGSLDGHTTHLIFLHHLHQLQPLCTSKKQDICALVPIWILYSQPLFQWLCHNSQTFPHIWHLWGHQRGGHFRQQDLGSMVDEEVLWLLLVFSDLCVVV